MKSNKVNFILVLISFLFALFATELLLKSYYQKYSAKFWKTRYNLYTQGDVFQNKGNFFKYFPNKSILLETYYFINNKFIKEYSHEIKTNNFGLVQENDISKDDSSILFLGDSITEGQGSYSWINKFKGNFQDLQVINGGILGTGPEQFELMEHHISENFNIKKVVVIYIGDDLRRPVWTFPKKTLDCLSNYKKCEGDENFYGFPFREKPVIPFLTKLQNFRDKKISEEENMKSFKKIRRKFRFFLKSLYIFKLPESILKKRFYKSKNKEIMNNFKAFEKLYTKYDDNIIFIRVTTKQETVNKKPSYESVYTEKFIKGLTNKHFICDFDGNVKSFYTHDPHPNSYGYNKLHECVKKILIKNFFF